MRVSRLLLGHAPPGLQSPKNAGVVFTSRMTPIRFSLEFKPWIFMCLVGFSGAMCGNFCYKRFLLRPNPPNPPRDMTEVPPQRHPHAPEEEEDD